MSKDHDLRTLELVHNGPINANKGCINPPLLSISFYNIVLDELHLMLRISDVLLRNLIWETIGQDIVESHHSRPAVYLGKLVEAIKSCGVTFQVIKN